METYLKNPDGTHWRVVISNCAIIHIGVSRDSPNVDLRSIKLSLTDGFLKDPTWDTIEEVDRENIPDDIRMLYKKAYERIEQCISTLYEDVLGGTNYGL